MRKTFAMTAMLLALTTTMTIAPGVTSASVAIEEQRSALLDCKHARGIGGAAYFQQKRVAPSSNAMAVQIMPYDQVSAQEANAINACAGGQVGLLPAAPRQPQTMLRSVRRPQGYGSAHCGATPSVLYKGDLYCTRRP